MKHVRDMTDAEFAAAMRAKAWRPEPPPAPKPVTSPQLASLVRQQVLAMPAAEFRAAVRARVWRTNLTPMTSR